MTKRIPFADDSHQLRAGCSSPYNHDWVEYESRRNPKGGGWFLTMRCSKCGTVFHQPIDRDGTILAGRQYDYPEGYLEGTSGWSRAQFRVSFLKGLG